MSVMLYFLLFKLRKWRKLLLNRIIEDETDKETLDGMGCTFQEFISAFTLFKKTVETIVSIKVPNVFNHKI